MRALVTGANGTIGSSLIALLAQRGHELRAFVRPTSDRALMREFSGEIFEGDVRDAAAVSRAAQGCDWVFHLAAARSANTSDRDEYTGVNIGGTRAVADAAIAAGVKRFVHASTVGVYGLVTRGMITEQTPLRPSTHYRLSKVRAEQELIARGQQLPYVIARLSSIVGPAAKSWLNFFRACGRADFRLIGAGKNLVQLGHAKDAADALLRCAEAPGIAGEAFNVSGSAAIPVRELARIVREEAGIRADIRHLPGAPYYAQARLADLTFRALGMEIPYASRYQLFIAQAAYDLTKAERMLGYAPRMTTSDCVRWSANYFRESGWL